MSQIIIVKNITTRVINLDGKDLQPATEFAVNSGWQGILKESAIAYEAIASGDIVVNDGVKDLSPKEGWKWMLGNTNFPMSEVGGKVWVHSSAKPVLNGIQLYSQWVGCGDDEDNHLLGQGPLAVLRNSPGTPVSQVDIKFSNEFGLAYIHEGFVMWENASCGDYINALIVAEGTHLQQVANLDLILDIDNYVLYSPQGPGTGTHGFASTPYLLSRSYSQDGDWDYDPVNSLRPNFTKTGGYKISQNEQVVHRFMNKLPVMGTNTSPLRLASEDTFQLPHGYFLRIQGYNQSNTSWNAAIIVTAYRQKTFQP
jgi:hypothetical protein